MKSLKIGKKQAKGEEMKKSKEKKEWQIELLIVLCCIGGDANEWVNEWLKWMTWWSEWLIGKAISA